MIRDLTSSYTNRSLVEIYNVKTFSSSRTISNLADLISDIDLLVDVGYNEYLRIKKDEFDRTENIISDTMHLRNLFVISDEAKKSIEFDERVAYVSRADLKVEIQFLETNQTYVGRLIEILKKTNKFNEKKNERIYTLKELSKYEDIMTEEEMK